MVTLLFMSEYAEPKEFVVPAVRFGARDAAWILAVGRSAYVCSAWPLGEWRRSVTRPKSVSWSLEPNMGQGWIARDRCRLATRYFNA